jgi:hypothetical protein
MCVAARAACPVPSHRRHIAANHPNIFPDFNARLWHPGGFHRPLGAREQVWKTKAGKANFLIPTSLSTDIDVPPGQRDVVQPITLRSNGEFNTIDYTYDDHFRGICARRYTAMTSAGSGCTKARSLP